MLASPGEGFTREPMTGANSLYEIETAISCEVEVETPFGKLLAHRVCSGETILTTGLDGSRVVVDGRRLFAHLCLGSSALGDIIALYDVETGKCVFPCRRGKPGDMIDGKAVLEFVDACRTAIQDALIPTAVRGSGMLMSEYRDNAALILDKVSEARHAMQEFEGVKGFHDPSYGRLTDFSHVHYREVTTKFGPVRIRFESDLLYVRAGRFCEHHYEKQSGIHGSWSMSCIGCVNWNRETNEVSFRTKANGKQSFEVADVKSRSQHEEVAAEILSQIRTYVSTTPNLKAELDREAKIERATIAERSRMEAIMCMQNAVLKRIELKERISKALMCEKGVAELMAVIEA